MIRTIEEELPTRIARATKLRSLLVLPALLLVVSAAQTQQTTQAPATDSAAQASPVQAMPHTAPTTDAASEASPEIGPTPKHPASVPPGTAVPVTLSESIDSGKLKNGDTVHATLSAPVRTSAGKLPAGTAVQISVIATVPAGKLNAVGEVSLQAMRVEGIGILTDTQTFRGMPGHKDLPDSAPATGTDAGLAKGAALTFHVQKPPAAADGPPPTHGVTPGSVNGRANGSAPPNNK